MPLQMMLKSASRGFDNRDYNNQRNILICAQDRINNGNICLMKNCPYYNADKICKLEGDTCDYLTIMGREAIRKAIQKLTQIGIGRKTKLVELLN